MKKNLLGILAGSISLFFLLESSGIVHAQNAISKYGTPSRLGGATRFDTAEQIADEYIKQSGTSLHNIILATGNDFPDSLSANVLAAKLNAPILLIDRNAKNSSSTLNYVNNKVDKNGSIYIVGGTGVVGSDVVNQLISYGYNSNNIHRIDGKDRFGTNTSIYNNLKALGLAKGTPIVLVTANDFPDALSISSIAAIKGYPIVLTDSSALSQSAKNIISDDHPSQVFLIGGTGVLKPQIETDIKSLLPDIGNNLIRKGGQDRYDTSAQIIQYFQLGGKDCVLATGSDFPDGIAGGVLAAKLNAPILLISDTSLDKQQLQIDSMNNISSITILGGEGVVSKKVESNFSKYQYGFDCASTYTYDKYKQFKDAGYSFVCRYYCNAVQKVTWKNCLTQQEAADISKAGLKIVPIYQDSYDKPDNFKYDANYYTPAQGATDAQRAISIAKSIGQPSNTAIYFAVDFEALTKTDFNAIDSYFNSVKATLKADSNKYKIGVYGSYNVINEVFKTLGQDTYTWQTYGWSKGNINTNSSLYQYQNDATLFGIKIDRDRTSSSDINSLGGFNITY